MGAAAAARAELLVVTDDNPRSEDPAAIRAEVLAGARGEPRRGEVREIGDRRDAIAAAVAAARPGDAVVVAGKGHETGQEIGDVTLPFDDAEELAAAIAATDHRREAERADPEAGPGARMIEMTLAEVAAVTGGRLHRATGAERVTAVEFDSRAGGPGRAVPGPARRARRRARLRRRRGRRGRRRRAGGPRGRRPRRDRAARRGRTPAAPIRWRAATSPPPTPTARAPPSSPRWPASPRTTSPPCPDLTVVGVTGCSGKTSTKDLLAAVLAPLGPTVAPPGSFNNELGQPWTALRADATTRHLVLELSARGAGHIAALCRVAPPRIGVVLNVGRAHLGEFGSPEAIAAGQGRAGRGAARPTASRCSTPTTRPSRRWRRAPAPGCVTVGRSPGADVRADDVVLDAGRARFPLVAPQGTADVALRLVGAHHVGNALAAAAVALECGATPEGVAAALSGAAPASALADGGHGPPRRRHGGQRRLQRQPRVDAGGAAGTWRRLATVVRPEERHSTRRTWAVLGRMAELGDAVRGRPRRDRPPSPPSWGWTSSCTVAAPEYGTGRAVAGCRRGPGAAARRAGARRRRAGEGLPGGRLDRLGGRAAR